MRNFVILTFLVLISQSKAYACSILNIDIGTSVSAASEKFDFLETFDPSTYGDMYSVRFTIPAKVYCEDSNLENADLEVIVYNSQIAGINVLSWDPNVKNEIYDTSKNKLFVGNWEKIKLINTKRTSLSKHIGMNLLEIANFYNKEPFDWLLDNAINDGFEDLFAAELLNSDNKQVEKLLKHKEKQ